MTLPIIGANPEWMERAKCRGMNSAQADATFFPEVDGPGKSNEAKRFCQGTRYRGDTPCPVQTECLQLALDTDSRWGIWGGVSERGRRYMHRDVWREGRETTDA